MNICCREVYCDKMMVFPVNKLHIIYSKSFLSKISPSSVGSILFSRVMFFYCVVLHSTVTLILYLFNTSRADDDLGKIKS